jgi:hypothetical protein
MLACEKAKKMLNRSFGGIDYESGTLNFQFTDYYTNEMGDNLKRKFLSFGRLACLDDIYRVKLRTNTMEARLSMSGKRTVNIDPGYLDLSKLVLFTTKDYSHRIHIKKGIYAESTLFFRDKTYNAWPWTYPDYKTTTYLDIFHSIRQIYKNQIGRN